MAKLEATVVSIAARNVIDLPNVPSRGKLEAATNATIVVRSAIDPPTVPRKGSLEEEGLASATIVARLVIS